MKQWDITRDGQIIHSCVTGRTKIEYILFWQNSECPRCSKPAPSNLIKIRKMIRFLKSLL